MAQSIARSDESGPCTCEHHFTAHAMTEKSTRMYKKSIASSRGKKAFGRSCFQVTPLALTFVFTNESLLVP